MVIAMRKWDAKEYLFYFGIAVLAALALWAIDTEPNTGQSVDPDQTYDGEGSRIGEYQPANVSIAMAESPLPDAEYQLRVTSRRLNGDERIIVEPAPYTEDRSAIIQRGGVFHSVKVDSLDDEVLVYSVDLDSEQVTIHYHGPLRDLPDVTNEVHES